MSKQSFITKDRNDLLTEMNPIDLVDILTEIEDYELAYRESLGLPEEVTFGAEIEFEGIKYLKIKRLLEIYSINWYTHYDGSLENGGEVTTPVLKDITTDWQKLQAVCNILKSERATTTKNAGGHVHVGAHILKKKKHWKNFIKTYIAYESIIYRFGYGDKINPRSELTHFATPVAGRMLERIEELDEVESMRELQEWIPQKYRYAGLNFSHVNFKNPKKNVDGNTIEFRCANGTIEEVIWQNLINTYTKLLLGVSENKVDMDFVNWKIKNEPVTYYDDKFMYNTVNLRAALEFCDLVFDNNLDKAYFLRQYLKNFQESDYNKCLIPAKSFVKKKED